MRNLTLLLLTITLFSHYNIKGQSQDFAEYFKYTIEGRNLADKGEIAEAYQAFEKAFETVELPTYYDIITMIEYGKYLGNEPEVIYFSKLLAENYGRYPSKKHFKDTVEYQQLHEDVSGLVKGHIESRDTHYVNTLKRLSDEDQYFRNYEGAIYRDNIDSDSIRLYQVLDLIKEKGFPSVRKVGMRAYYDAMLIFLHADFDLDHEVLGDLMYESVMQGKMDPQNYAGIVDRRCNYSRRDLYYFQVPIGYSGLSSEYKEIIRQRRAAIGLRDVEQDMKIEIMESGDLRTIRSR